MRDGFWRVLAQAGNQPGFDQVFSALSGQAGVIAICIIILYSGYKGWWVWGRDLAKAEARIVELKTDQKEERDRLRTELEEWKKVAMTGLRAAERAVLQEEIKKGGHGGSNSATSG